MIPWWGMPDFSGRSIPRDVQRCFGAHGSSRELRRNTFNLTLTLHSSALQNERQRSSTASTISIDARTCHRNGQTEAESPSLRSRRAPIRRCILFRHCSIPAEHVASSTWTREESSLGGSYHVRRSVHHGSVERVANTLCFQVQMSRCQGLLTRPHSASHAERLRQSRLQAVFYRPVRNTARSTHTYSYADHLAGVE